MSPMKKKSVCPVLSFVCAAAVVFVVVCYAVFRIMLAAVDSEAEEKTVRVEVPYGAGVRSVGEMLERSGLIRSAKAFYLAERFPVLVLRGKCDSIKSGVYSVRSSMSAVEIIELFESGEQEYIKTVIPEGLTVRKVGAILENDGICSADDFSEAARSKELLSEYGIPADSFEGFLFPDTYFFTPQMESRSVLCIMVDNFFSRVSVLPQFSGQSPADFYKTLVLASIVEREYRVAEEAPLIASVFINRIRAGIGLYSCATIEYIITEIEGREHPDVITYDDLKIDSPYNTYKWAALPPSPISNPGMVALSAVADAPETDYYYFTLTDSASGSHTFSTSFNAHIRAGTEFRTKKTGR